MLLRGRSPFSGLVLSILTSLVAALLVVTALGVSAQADPVSPGTPADGSAPAGGASAAGADPGDPEQVAEQALETVEELIADPAASLTATGGEKPDLTNALTDLAEVADDLRDDRAAEAKNIMARPTDPTKTCATIDLVCYGPVTDQRVCAGGVCVHYVTSGPNAVAPENDGPGGLYPGTAGGRPDYVETVLDTVRHVRDRYRAAGYRAVLPDGTAGGTANDFDVYLGQMPSGYYGYCVSSPSPSAAARTASSYCVLDNDYREYAKHTPLQNLQVTVAHEYFHAVQVAYDATEAVWFREATATWAEDEVYDGINDNRQFLRDGPLGKPGQPLNASAARYGSWIFFRYLSERYPAATGGMANIVRQIWERSAHSGPGAAGQTNLSALSSVLAARGSSFRVTFGKFAAANRYPATSYSEGAAYRLAPTLRGYRIKPGKRVALSTKLSRRASGTVRFKSMTGGKRTLKVHVTIPKATAGGYAMVTIKRAGKKPVTKRLHTNKAGRVKKSYSFGKGVDWVELTLANASSKRRPIQVNARVR
ncbi:hypothetical protein JK386_16055 [Nocardioides sp. zg-536]|uniref:Uncharacterized protein n=1 Tax=Nocardioides faecalis TaxID=2803858 RepID=A0A938Y398_9ACTN|nr:MXAN_6640 family putative metalloprotease [Nocardioides faecalis]MBM9461417.1 hypothetical protein [Nocardioides faecalis]QVI59391.1 hypothetical protein KG111_03205 [Nocardioides faecalis]